MESIGARFSQTREAKGYTIEQVARDTHIAKRFLEALEAEDFASFPGEPYLLGFMRTYSNYLGLDPEETVTLYHNLTLQEQPPPIDELIFKRPSVPLGRILVIALAVLAVGVGGYFAIAGGLFSGGEETTAQAAGPEPEPSDPPPPEGDLFEMMDEIVEQRFSEGDRIVLPIADERYPIDLSRVGDGITLSYGDRTSDVPVGTETLLDVNDDAQSDLRVIVRSVDTLDSPPTVVMRLDRGAAAARAGVVVPDSPGEAVEAPAIGATLEPSREEGARLIAAFDERDEFAVEVRFEGYALFRYEADDEPRVERFFQTGDTVRTSVRDQFKLWVSNAASARLRVAGQDVALGDPGEVTAGLIAWVPDPATDRVLLELLPVY
ncbi:MAG: helix-turn-helix domain-containing protein [Spirochaetota bacterium]